jgi:hypothetical protein
MERVLDIIVPFGPFLRRVESSQPFLHWPDLVLHVIPLTFFFYWLCSLIPFAGTLFYVLVLVPLSANRHIKLKATSQRLEKFSIYLWYYVVITIGFSGIWGFIGHTIMADTVAAGIGWPQGSPFQTELAFYTLGSSVAGLMAIWLRGHMITALVVTKSVFLYGAALVHIQDALVNKNYEPLNIGAPLVGDVVIPTLLLVLLIPVLKNQLKDAVAES